MRNYLMSAAVTVTVVGSACSVENIDCTNKQAHRKLFDEMRSDFEVIARHAHFILGSNDNREIQEMVTAYDTAIADRKTNILASKSTKDWMNFKYSLKFVARTIDSSEYDRSINKCSCRLTVDVVGQAPNHLINGKFAIDYTLQPDLATSNGVIVESNFNSVEGK